jgi:hypothetical protein
MVLTAFELERWTICMAVMRRGEWLVVAAAVGKGERLFMFSNFTTTTTTTTTTTSSLEYSLVSRFKNYELGDAL